MAKSTERVDLDDLINRVKRERCETSFRGLFDYFYPRLVSYFTRGGVLGQKASDLAQETLFSVWNKASYFDSSKGSCASWIFTIARNIRYDHFRSESSEILNLVADDLYEEIEDPFFDFDTKNASDDLKKRIENLPAEQREVVYAMYFEGYSHGEYAELKKIPLGTVKSRLRLALAQIKKGLEES